MDTPSQRLHESEKPSRRRQKNTRQPSGASTVQAGDAASHQGTAVEPLRRPLIAVLLFWARLLRFCAWALLLLLPLLGLLFFAPPDSGRLYLARRAVRTAAVHLPTIATVPLALYSKVRTSAPLRTGPARRPAPWVNPHRQSRMNERLVCEERLLPCVPTLTERPNAS